jgi:hypothetical protein
MAPPRDSVLRVSRFPHAQLHEGCPTLGAAAEEHALQLETPARLLVLDFLMVGPVFREDLAWRPELALVWPAIAFRSDRFRPDPREENQELAGSTHLDADIAFDSRTLGDCPARRRLRCFNGAAMLSPARRQATSAPSARARSGLPAASRGRCSPRMPSGTRRRSKPSHGRSSAEMNGPTAGHDPAACRARSMRRRWHAGAPRR